MSRLLTVTDFKVILSKKYVIIRRGSSVVERKPEELSVVGSIPTPGTSHFSKPTRKHSYFVG